MERRKIIGTEMMRYKCHKEVWAMKIAKIEPHGLARLEEVLGAEVDGGATITDEGGAYITVNREYMEKHNPQVGGYYVVYKDGYESFSPAGPFEDGYTLNSELEPDG